MAGLLCLNQASSWQSYMHFQLRVHGRTAVRKENPWQDATQPQSIRLCACVPSSQGWVWREPQTPPPPMHKTQTKLSHPNSRDDHIGFAQQVIFFCHARKFCNLDLITVKETSKQGSCQSQIEFSVHGRTIMPEPGKLMAELHAFPTQSPWQDCSPKRKSMAGCNSATVNQALRLCPRFPSGE